MTVDADPHDECASCDHSPAYHDGENGRPCRAWDPDQADHKCACKGWKKPEPVPASPSTPKFY